MEKKLAALASARERHAAITNELRRLKSKEFPKQVSWDLLSALELIVRDVGLRIHRYAELSTSQDDSGEDTPSDTLAALVSPLLPVHDMLAWFDKTDSSRIPHELLEGFEQLTGDLLVPEQEHVAFVFVPARDYNYSVLDLHADLGRKRLSPRWKPVMDLRPHPVQVSFPAAEAGSTLLHTLLYHEIGHLFYKRRLSCGPIFEAATLQLDAAEKALAIRMGSHFQGQLQEMGLSIPNEGSSAEYRANYEEVLSKRRSLLKSEARRTLFSWIEEICCDLIALRLAGPAFVCAFQFFWDPFLVRTSCSLQHPHWITRSKFLGAYSRNLQVELPGFKAMCELFGEHADLSNMSNPPAERGANSAEILDYAKEDGDFAFGIAAQAISASDGPLMTCLAQVLKQCPSPFADPAMAKRVGDACAQIAVLAPPIQRHPFFPVSHAEVLAIAFSSAWLFRTRDMQNIWQDSASFGWNDGEALGVLGQLLLAAVEAGDLELRYHRSRNGLEPTT